MKQRYTFSCAVNGVAFRQQLLLWSKTFDRICWLDGKGFSPLNHSANVENRIGLMALGSHQELIERDADVLESIDEFYNENADWLFGFFSYDLKNKIEKLTSENQDGIEFPMMHVFCPELVFDLSESSLTLYYLSETMNPSDLIQSVLAIDCNVPKNIPALKSSQIRNRFTKNEYLQNVNQILAHIQRGDIYEMNFCMEFYVEGIIIHPQDVFLKLTELSPLPFAAFYKMDDSYLMCASPERFLRKEGSKVISQPMKGTIRRGKNKEEDLVNRKYLQNDSKEQSENVMIVDLVRNDLSKLALASSVKVDELFGVYSFPRVFQMISTVSAILKPDILFSEILKAMFPMGSMTGAPKVKAMELIERFERTKRGLFSGAVGYISPERDFDFNVVIRSILYNSKNKYLSYQAGSAITIGSVPENEYAECVLKADTMFETFQIKNQEKSD